MAEVVLTTTPEPAYERQHIAVSWTCSCGATITTHEDRIVPKA